MKRHILVADDEEPVLDLLSTFFRRKGFKVSTASTADETLKALQKQTVHLVILDLVWPEADGLQLLETIHSVRPRAKVIIVTGMGFRDDLVKETKERGATGYVSKTFSLDDLMQEVSRVLSLDRRSGSVEQRN